MKNQVQTIWKNKISYSESLVLQEELKKQARQTKNIFLLGFECPAVITLGLRARSEEDLQADKKEYQKRGIDVVLVKRGGQATVHSLGQLVIYPILDLRQWKIRPRDFLSLLEDITIKTFQKYNVDLQKKENSAGLFTDTGKIVFFGIHISQGVNQHGLSINVSNDLKLFQLIKSCGKLERKHDSLKNRGRDIRLEDLFFSWCGSAKEIWI